MKIVYHYVLPLLLLALSVNYLQGSNSLSTENVINEDDAITTVGVYKEPAEQLTMQSPILAGQATDEIEYDRRNIKRTVDKSDLADEDAEESNDTVVEAQVDGFMAMYADDRGDAEDVEVLSPDMTTSATNDTNYSDVPSSKFYAAQASTAQTSRQVVNIEISGNQITTSQSGVTTREVYGNVTSVNNIERSDTVMTDAQQNIGASQNMDNVNDESYPDIVDTTGQQNTLELNCPDTLYMGGNAYAVSMLKKRGCPKPANYQGPW